MTFVKESQVLDLDKLAGEEFVDRAKAVFRHCHNMHLNLRDGALGGSFRILIPWGQRAQGSSHMGVSHLETVDVAGVNPSKSSYVS